MLCRGVPRSEIIMRVLRVCCLALCLASAVGLRVTTPPPGVAAVGRAPAVQMAESQVSAQIEKLVTDNKIMLFMKGNKMFPQCGFSNTAVQILNSMNVEFETFDVLADESMRNGIKECA